jgi:hypothetical protein
MPHFDRSAGPMSVVNSRPGSVCYRGSSYPSLQRDFSASRIVHDLYGGELREPVTHVRAADVLAEPFSQLVSGEYGGTSTAELEEGASDMTTTARHQAPEVLPGKPHRCSGTCAYGGPVHLLQFAPAP